MRPLYILGALCALSGCQFLPGFHPAERFDIAGGCFTSSGAEVLFVEGAALECAGYAEREAQVVASVAQHMGPVAASELLWQLRSTVVVVHPILEWGGKRIGGSTNCATNEVYVEDRPSWAISSLDHELIHVALRCAYAPFEPEAKGKGWGESHGGWCRNGAWAVEAELRGHGIEDYCEEREQ